MNQPIINDPRARFWGRMAKWSLVLVAGFFVAPYVWTAITGVLGLIAATVVIGGAWMLGKPAYSMAANLRLRLIKAEARKNPVETLQNEFIAESKKLEERREKIEALNTSIRNLGDSIDDLTAKYGAGDPAVQKLTREQANLTRVLEYRRVKLQQALAELKRFQEQIERLNDIWQATQSANAARDASGLTEDEVISKIRKDEAVDAVRTSYNAALASLEESMAMDVTVPPPPSGQPTLTAPPPTISLPSSAPSQSRDHTH